MSKKNFFQETLTPPGTPAMPGRKQIGMMKLSPQTEAVLNKLVSSSVPARSGMNGKRMAPSPSPELIHKISDATANNVNDSESIMQVLPDLKMVKNILISSIISPNDMVNSKLTVSVPDSEIDSKLTAAFVEIVDEFITKEYRLADKLQNILENVLFTKGCHPMIVLPESSIDDLINSPERVSMESIRSSGLQLSAEGELPFKGFLGPNDVELQQMRGSLTGAYISEESSKIYGLLGMESKTVIDVHKSRSGTVVKIDGKPAYSVTDNPDILKVPLLKKRFVNDQASALLGEKAKRTSISDREVEGMFYPNRHYKIEMAMAVKTQDQLKKPTVGHPIVMTPPAESVIPVHVPGDPSHHVGYFLLLDESGHPINKAENENYYNDLSVNTSGQNRNMTSQLISNVRQATLGISQNVEGDIRENDNLFTQMIEDDLMQRLKNGLYGNGVKISNVQNITRVMMARALSKQLTRVLYIPSSLMTYIAFDYNHLGIGKSLLEDTKILCGLRSMLLFANTMAEIKNSVGHEVLKIELDPDDPEPARTVEFLLHEYSKNRQTTFPLGASNPYDLVNFMQNAGVQVAVSGNEAYPATNFDVEDKQTQRPEVNTNLMDDLRKRHYNSFGVPPELVDAASGTEFATTAVRNNIIFTKTTKTYQNKLTPPLTDHVQKYITNDQYLMDSIRQKYDDIIGKPNGLEDIQKKETIIGLLIDGLVLELPSPDTVELTTQLDAFQEYNTALDETLKAYLSEEAYGETLFGELAKSIPAVTATLKSFYQRKWLREQNVMPELEEIVTFSETEGPGINLLKEQLAHLDGLNKTLIPFMLHILKVKKKYDAELQAAGGIDGSGGGGDFGSDSGSSDTGGGDDDFDMGDDGNGGGDDGMSEDGTGSSDDTGSTDDVSGDATSDETGASSDEEGTTNDDEETEPEDDTEGTGSEKDEKSGE